MEKERSGDLVLPQGTYVLLQDGASGEVKVVTGPHKVSLADTDNPVIYEREARKYAPANSDIAIKICPVADEGQYIVLTNPINHDTESKQHPQKGKQDVSVTLSMGRRVNIQGPETFALFPGQIADVVDGHQLKSNEYLLIRIYNENEAKENLGTAVIKSADIIDSKSEDKESEDKNKSKKKKESQIRLFEDKEIKTGNLLIIKGTDVSFYIPPTGIEVIDEKGKFTRNAVTLERLEYCILLDQNGDKRFVKGPDVIFPKPTESFIEHKNKKVFRAIELNDNMGIYIKVIADYTEGENNFKAGQELFITGKEQKIYFPRAEHAIIKYGQETIHFSTTVPTGEGRYILDKDNGEIKTIKGPKMLLSDPRKYVIVNRILNDKTVNLWFPDNKEALKHNQNLRNEILDPNIDYVTQNFVDSSKSSTKYTETVLASAIAGTMGDELDRRTSYTKPRSIKLDTKYEGAVLLNIWPNYAVQVINKSGDRKIIEGPKVVMLNYDETLEIIELSTGKPKTDKKLIQTVYLQTKNNIVSDTITVETSDLINVDIQVSYKVNFEEDSKKWFNVSDYVKLLTQHMCSLIRNVAKKKTIEDFNSNVTDIIRDTILGTEAKRIGRKFEENGMRIYDVEILNITIGDEEISKMLISSQHNTVRQHLDINILRKNLEFNKKQEEYHRLELDEKFKTSTKENEIKLEKENHSILFKEIQLEAENKLQEVIDNIIESKRTRQKLDEDQNVLFEKERSNIRINELEKELTAITPGLIEAIISSNDVKLSSELAKNLRERTNGSGLFSNGPEGGFKGFLETIKGTNLEKGVKKIIEDYKNLREIREKNFKDSSNS